MNLSETEFSTVTDKLEKYASQVSTLQARLDAQITINEIQEQRAQTECRLYQAEQERDMLSMQLAEAQNIIATQKKEIEQKNQENSHWKSECERLTGIIKSAVVENAFLKNCIILSVPGIKHFFTLVRQISSKALLHTFLIKTVSPDMGPEALEVINNAVDLEEVPEGKLADQIIFENSGTIGHN